MTAVLILLVIFAGVALITYVDNTTARRRSLPGPASGPGRALQPGPAALAAPQGETPETLTLALPEPARRQGWELLCLLHDGLSTLGAEDTRTRFLLSQTRASYLPDTLRAYLHLTEGARRQLRAQGQDPETLLSEQLTLMRGGVEEALRRDHAAADRLLTQGRFLRERFGDAEGSAETELSLPRS